MTVNITVVALMPSATISSAMAAKPGSRRNVRSAYEASRIGSSSQAVARAPRRR